LRLLYGTGKVVDDAAGALGYLITRTCPTCTSRTVTRAEFLKDPAAATRTADELGSVTITDDAGRQVLVISGNYGYEGTADERRIEALQTELASVIQQRDAYLANLTATQQRCTELLLELRECKGRLGNMGDGE
jgi:hypothetical protein